MAAHPQPEEELIELDGQIVRIAVEERNPFLGLIVGFVFGGAFWAGMYFLVQYLLQG